MRKLFAVIACSEGPYKCLTVNLCGTICVAKLSFIFDFSTRPVFPSVKLINKGFE